MFINHTLNSVFYETRYYWIERFDARNSPTGMGTIKCRDATLRFTESSPDIISYKRNRLYYAGLRRDNGFPFCNSISRPGNESNECHSSRCFNSLVACRKINH